MHEKIQGARSIERKNNCTKHIKSKYFKTVMQSIYTLMQWPIASKNCFTEIRIRTNYSFAKIEYYFNEYHGNRFPRQLIYNFIAFYRKEYGNLFPSVSTLNYIFDALIEIKLLYVETSELDRTQDILIDEQICVFIEEWARHIHLPCEKELFKLLEIYLNKDIAA
jgi:hypothetical protein